MKMAGKSFWGLLILEEVGRMKQATFSTADLLVLDLVHRDQSIPQWLRDRLKPLRELGIVERIGRKYILSRRFYTFVGKKGVYTRKRGLDRETNKELLLKHIHDSRHLGCQLQELMDVLPALSRNQVQTLLREMKRDGILHSVGRTRGARWYPESN